MTAVQSMILLDPSPRVYLPDDLCDGPTLPPGYLMTSLMAPPVPDDLCEGPMRQAGQSIVHTVSLTLRTAFVITLKQNS